MALRFLIDECLHTSLRGLAQYEAEHVVYHSWNGTQDGPLAEILLDEEWTLVTNNGPDFLAILNRKITRDGLELHPGLVLFLHNVRPDAQRVLFQAPLDYLDGRDDLINTVLEVDVDPTTAALLDPNRRLDEVTWAQVCDQLRPQFREFPLP